MTTAKPSRSWTGTWVFFIVYAVSLVWMYNESTPEITAGNISEREERHFRVAGVKVGTAPGASPYVIYTLAQLRKPGVDLSQVTFLLPEKVVAIPDSDFHRATVLESHTDRQLIEYEFGNTHTSLSRYRAFKDRVEPVSFRVTSHVGMVIMGFFLIFPALIAAGIASWIARKIRDRSGQARQ